MRGFTNAVAGAAALLSALTPASARPHGRNDVGQLTSWTHLSVPLGEDRVPLKLRLDTGNLRPGQVCDSSMVTVNGQPLPVENYDDADAQAISFGQGDLRIDDATVAASWTFQCATHAGQPLELWLDFNVHALDGEGVSEPTAFFSRFSYRSIHTFGDDAVDGLGAWPPGLDRPGRPPFSPPYPPPPPPGPPGHPGAPPPPPPPGHPGGPPPPPPPPPPPSKFSACETVRCLMDTLAEDSRQTAHYLTDFLKVPEFIWNHHGQRPPPPPHHGDGARFGAPGVPTSEDNTENDEQPVQDDEPGDEPVQHGELGDDSIQYDELVVPNIHNDNSVKPIFVPEDDEWTPSMGDLHRTPTHLVPTHSHSLLSLPSLPPPDESLMLTLGVAAIAFGVFSLFSIGLIHHRFIARAPRVSTYRRETREEMLARVENNRQATKAFFQRLFCGLFGYEEKQEERPSPQGRDTRSDDAGVRGHDDDESPSTSMEQELANFREAASMVSNLIAAEEGRNQMRQQYRPQPPIPQRQQPPMHPMPATFVHSQTPHAGGFESHTSLPSYESDTVDASMVADGFRPSPGGTEYTPSSSPEAGSRGISDSDRLGYGNKD